MHIIYGVDDNFIPLLSVSISSVLHTMQGETLHFHILSMGCKKENEEKLRHFIEGEGQTARAEKTYSGLKYGKFFSCNVASTFYSGSASEECYEGLISRCGYGGITVLNTSLCNSSFGKCAWYGGGAEYL